MARYDVIVVGGGPAGSTAAYHAARLGMKVLVVDRFQFPREKACGGGLTPRSWRLLESVGTDYTWLGSCDEIVVRLAGLEYRHRGLEIRVVRRTMFDKELLDRATSMGADFVRDAIVRVGDGWVEGRGGVYEGRLVIGADGSPSTVAKSIGVDNYGGHRTHAIALMNIAPYDAGNTCTIDFDSVRDLVGMKGYAWVFPLGDRSNIGMGVGWGKWPDLRAPLLRFMEGIGASPGDGMYGHPISLGYVKSLGRGAAVLIGEAAGLVDPLTGEGIYYALRSGMDAAYASYLALKVHMDPGKALRIYSRLVEDLVDEVRRARTLGRILTTVGYRRSIVERLGRRLVGMFVSVYSGSATYGPVPLSVRRLGGK